MFICKSQYFVMQNEQKSLLILYMYKAFDCGILVDECLSHNVLWFSYRGFSEHTNLSAAYEQ